MPTGQPVPDSLQSADPLGADRILQTYRHRLKRLDALRCPVDQRIESFLESHFAGVADPGTLQLPDSTIVLDRHGIARELSLPIDGDEFHNHLVDSYRVHNGVLHNPRHDRRTTSGTFHVTEGGLPIPQDKKAVPRITFVRLFQAAMNPPAESLELPFTADQTDKASCFVSLLLRPLLCPEVQGVCEEQTIEVRFCGSRLAGFQSGLCRIHFRQRRRSVPAGKRRRTGCCALEWPHRLRPFWPLT